MSVEGTNFNDAVGRYTYYGTVTQRAKALRGIRRPMGGQFGVKLEWSLGSAFGGNQEWDRKD